MEQTDLSDLTLKFNIVDAVLLMRRTESTNGLVPTMSDRWLSPIVKLCFPAEASRLCRTTSCRFFSHTALWNRISV